MLKKRLLLVGLACGWLIGVSASQAPAATHGHKAMRSFLMFKEKHKETYNNGQPKAKGTIAQICLVKQFRVYTCPQGAKQAHVKHGKWKWWWPNGQKMAKKHYHLGQLEGVSKAWFANGTLRWSEHYKHGKLDGVRTVFYLSGQRKRQEQYKGGLRDGEQTLWWWNGKRSSQGSYANGQRVGLWRSWYSNGDVKEEVRYVRGKRHGVYTLYRSVCQPSGCSSVKSVEGSYNQGKKNGTWYRWFFDASGQKKSKAEVWNQGQRTL